MGSDKSCCSSEGWLSKRLWGMSWARWGVMFAVLPYTAAGVKWTVDFVSGLWDSISGAFNG
jgi:hypothetical protein